VHPLTCKRTSVKRRTQTFGRPTSGYSRMLKRLLTIKPIKIFSDSSRSSRCESTLTKTFCLFIAICQLHRLWQDFVPGRNTGNISNVASVILPYSHRSLQSSKSGIPSGEEWRSYGAGYGCIAIAGSLI